jgi:hypothetical protein
MSSPSLNSYALLTKTLDELQVSLRVMRTTWTQTTLMNAWKHGGRSAETRALSRALAAQARVLQKLV